MKSIPISFFINVEREGDDGYMFSVERNIQEGHGYIEFLTGLSFALGPCRNFSFGLKRYLPLHDALQFLIHDFFQLLNQLLDLEKHRGVKIQNLESKYSEFSFYLSWLFGSSSWSKRK